MSKVIHVPTMIAMYMVINYDIHRQIIDVNASGGTNSAQSCFNKYLKQKKQVIVVYSFSQ